MGSTPLSEEDRAQLSARADEFHAALVRGGVTDWDRYLAGLPEHIRPAVLTELVIIDLGHRWGCGERPFVEDYVARFPEFGPIDRVPAAVILEEYRGRLKAGDRPDPETYRERFPGQYPGIMAELESVRGGTVSGTVVSTIASDDGGEAMALSHSPGGAASDYDFIRVLGRGVFGEVWLARKRTSGIEKAVKILMQAADHEAANRERRALELIKNLRHPYLLATEDFWITDNRLHVAMELADCTLRDQLRRRRDTGLPGVPLAELLGYMWEAAEGLDFLHSRHVIHRDVKPDNILLSHGHAKVGDFGLARYQEEVLAPMRTFAGTPAYMAPEVWGRSGGPQSDQYSLAIAYTELRQGVPPLRPRPIQEMLLAHAEGSFEFNDPITPAEETVIRKALSHKPEDRFHSCRAFVEALCTALDLSGVPRAAGSFGSVPAGHFSPHEPTQPDSGIGHSTHGDKGTIVNVPVPTAVEPPPDSVFLSRRRLALAAVLLVALAAGIGAAFSRWFGPTGTQNKGDENTFNPETNPPWLPPDTAKAEGAKPFKLVGDKWVYDGIEMKISNETVRFRLIRPTSNPPAPFYIMESKVWNSLYQTGSTMPPKASLDNGPDAPVTGIPVDAAHAFAKSIGGMLPSAEEWDHAVGYYSPNPQPVFTLGAASPRVKLTKPAPTHDPKDPDENEFGLRDMSGNGREFTRDRFQVGSDNFVILRGRSFTLPKGLTRADLDYEQTEPQRQLADKPSPYTSFRVVLPIP